ncbi:hypothetical protein Rhe02_44660 [Rhizocola hellebori]|uniref:Transmembrane protein n=1 Tax=Rhizocola hellebori TaxID=1392758 RepID=A0A8J3VGI4_9ACTN|nr:hypothetical protein [Rhizocola hellebori]GIH06399.1 hypothetical protein Rhe02_44660 [Rhizocola hellebori]
MALGWGGFDRVSEFWTLDTNGDIVLIEQKNAIGAGILALMFLGGGLFAFDTSTVKCGSEAMAPTDTCQETKKGVSRTLTYQEVKDSQVRWKVISLGLGVASVGGVGWYLVQAGRRRREEQESAASVGLFMGPPTT